MSKIFASRGDLAEKKVTFRQISPSAWVYEAESDPTTGVIIAEDGVVVVDARATPTLARDVLDRIRQVTDKPVRFVVLTHYHAVRTLGAPAFAPATIVSSSTARQMIRERGEADFRSEVGRFPRLFNDVESVHGLVWPQVTFDRHLNLWLGDLGIELRHLGRGHTAGDIVVRIPEEGVVFAGDLVENGAAVYMGDSHPADWIATLDRLRALGDRMLVPGRGPALTDTAAVRSAIDLTQTFVRTLHDAVGNCVAKGLSLRAAYEHARAVMDPQFASWPIYEHCIPFDVSRCYDVHCGIDVPRVWTAERDLELWRELQG